MDNQKEAELIARLILSTKRKKRNFTIVEIATDINSLREILGDLNKVSKVIGISSGMLNQFLSVFKLPIEIQRLIQERKIDSVAMVFLLSKFPEEDLIQLSEKVSKGEIRTQDLKVLLPYRKQHPTKNISHLIDEINSSKNIRISIIKIPKNLIKKSVLQISDTLNSIVGEDNFVTIIEGENFIDIKIKKEGERILRSIAKEKKMTLSNLISTITN